MFEPEYRMGFHVLQEQIGTMNALKIGILSCIQSCREHYKCADNASQNEKTKTRLKNHFKLLAAVYTQLCKTYGQEQAETITQKILMEGGKVFFRGFTPLQDNEHLKDFVRVYSEFERNNIVFDILKESEKEFEIEIKRCLVYESFQELGISKLTKWMCDIAFAYFNNYHPQMKYYKDRMIARGDKTCHEVFVWEETQNHQER